MCANLIKRSKLPKSRIIINLDKVVVGQIISIQKHPDADVLRIAQVDVGEEKLQIIFGGGNIERVGAKVAIALLGSKTGKGKLKKEKFRDETSEGMICSAVELGLVDEGPDEILILPDNLEVGRPMELIKDKISI